MGDTMAKIMKRAAVGFVCLTLLCAFVYIYIKNSLVFGLLITFATTAYHFVMRLLVGFAFDRLMPNPEYREDGWFRVSAREQRFYERMNVKRWKGHIPTYDPTEFDSGLHSWEEILGAMCRAELVHETIMVLSFVPILAASPLGALGVFVITSILAACFDGIFVVMQRYNRPRVIRLLRISRRRKNRTI